MEQIDIGEILFLDVECVSGKPTFDELDENETLKAELEEQYYTALSELEEMKGSNEELNTLIEQQQAELKDQKDKIDRLIRSKRDLNKAREEIKNLTAQAEQYLAEITNLKAENEELTANNTRLTQDKAQLEDNLAQSNIANEELLSTKAKLVSEKENLESERAVLSKKVNYASVVRVKDLEVTGFKTKSTGKAVKKRYAKNVDHLQICFNTTKNEVAEAGLEKFFIRILNPVGETMAVEEMGSGVLTLAANDEAIRFTQVAETEYNNDADNLCMNWSPNNPFSEGMYKVEVYNKGYLAGETEFQLK